MNKQLVQDWMTCDLVTIPKDTSLTAASRLMEDNHIRHVLVVQKNKLVGVVTWGDIREASPSDATTLSVFELGYLLDKLPVSKIMTCNPITTTPTATITDAAQIMLENKIGCLPVVEKNKAVGILTESDIFRMLVASRAD
jgi:CBS domain-containing protein